MFLNELKNMIISQLGWENVNFSYPPSMELGDLSLACFEAAKTNNQNPVETAKMAAKKLNEITELKKYFLDIKTVGPYLNFYIKPAYLAIGVIKEIKSCGVSYGESCCNKKRIIIEYSNGNTHKEYHVGHLRNIAFGTAVTNLLRVTGQDVTPVSYINDLGIHTAKTIWNWQHNTNYQERPENKGYLLGKCYAEASRILEENPEKKNEVAQIKKDIEGRMGDNYRFWQLSRQWSIDYFASIYQELNIKFSHIFYESEYIDDGLKKVDELITKGILRRSEGAIIADLTEYKLGILPVIRTDSTALYPVADLALAFDKLKRFKPDESVYIVDVRQSLYLLQLFKLLELIGYQGQLSHLTYDFVTLPSGMMSSRSGNVITFEELNVLVYDKLFKETQSRHPEWSKRRIVFIVKNLTVATVKFEMLKVSSDKIIVFNIEDALRFDGYTVCYIMYGYARLMSVVSKSGFDIKIMADYEQLTDSKEKALVLKMAQYPEILQIAAIKRNPSEICKYLFELTQIINDYYHHINIRRSPWRLKIARLALIKAAAQVLSNGLNILGITVHPEM